MLAKLLSRRLQSVIDESISAYQNGYIKGRYIGENIRTIFETLSDIIEFTTFLNRPGIMALVYFEKASDTVNWSFLYRER